MSRSKSLCINELRQCVIKLRRVCSKGIVVSPYTASTYESETSETVGCELRTFLDTDQAWWKKTLKGESLTYLACTHRFGYSLVSLVPPVCFIITSRYSFVSLVCFIDLHLFALCYLLLYPAISLVSLICFILLHLFALCYLFHLFLKQISVISGITGSYDKANKWYNGISGISDISDIAGSSTGKNWFSGVSVKVSTGKPGSQNRGQFSVKAPAWKK